MITSAAQTGYRLPATGYCSGHRPPTTAPQPATDYCSSYRQLLEHGSDEHVGEGLVTGLALFARGLGRAAEIGFAAARLMEGGGAGADLFGDRDRHPLERRA